MSISQPGNIDMTEIGQAVDKSTHLSRQDSTSTVTLGTGLFLIEGVSG